MRYIPLAVLIVFTGSLFFVACEKPVLNETELIPNDNTQVRKDTLDVIANTVRDDSVIGNGLSRSIVGTMYEPGFGWTYAGFFTQFYLPGDSINFDNATLDSVVLSLDLDGCYGDFRSEAQAFEIFKLTENIDDEETYYSDENFSYGEKIGSWYGQVNCDNTALNIRIQNSALGSGVFNAISSASSDDFQAFFNGVYVTANERLGGKGLVYFSPTLSVLRIYYRNAGDTENTLLQLPMTANGTVSSFRHEYTDEINDLINNPDMINGDSLIFIQPLAGVHAKIRIPGVKNLGRILINKAELVINRVVVGDHANNAFPPADLVPRTDPDKTALSDNKWDFSTTDGELNNSRYVINLANYLQNTIGFNQQDSVLFILPTIKYRPSPSSTVEDALERNILANSVIVGGGSHSTAPMKLHLTYTIIE